MTEKRLTTRQWQAWDSLLRWCCFVGFATVGMATIGLAVLAQPLASYFNNQEALRLHEQAIDDLIELRDQQGRLLANSNHPSVVERVAIQHLKYQSAQSARAEKVNLPDSWPDLTRAVEQVKQAGIKEDKNHPGQYLIHVLANRNQSQWMLFVLGSVLVVISLLAFSTPTSTTPRKSTKTPIV